MRAHTYQVPASVRAIIAPGAIPARNSLVMEICATTPNTTMAIEGGITGAMMPPAAIRPAARGTL